MEHTLPDIILFPIPFVCLFAYLKEVESYITMFKKRPKLLTGIIIGCLVILVFVIVGNAHRLIYSCTDAHLFSNDFNAYEGVNAIFAGLAFIGILYTLHQQQKSLNVAHAQLKESLIQQEKASIQHSINNLQTTLSNLNSLYNSIQANRRTENDTAKEKDADIFKDIHFSEYLYDEVCKIFEYYEKEYPLQENIEQQNRVKATVVYRYRLNTQKFLEIAYPLRVIYDRIEKSTILTQEDKKLLGKEAFFLLNHSDVKILDLMYSEHLFKENFPYNKTFNESFSSESAKTVIMSLSLTHQADRINEFAILIRDSAILQEEYHSIYEEASRNLANQRNNI